MPYRFLASYQFSLQVNLDKHVVQGLQKVRDSEELLLVVLAGDADDVLDGVLFIVKVDVFLLLLFSLFVLAADVGDGDEVWHQVAVSIGNVEVFLVFCHGGDQCLCGYLQEALFESAPDLIRQPRSPERLGPFRLPGGHWASPKSVLAARRGPLVQ